MIFNCPSSLFATRHTQWNTFRRGIRLNEWVFMCPPCVQVKAYDTGGPGGATLRCRVLHRLCAASPIFCNYNSPSPCPSAPQAPLHHMVRDQSSYQSALPELRPPRLHLWVKVASTDFQKSFSNPISFQLLPLLTTVSGWTGNWSFLNRVLTV